jgi:hypothetical protein
LFAFRGFARNDFVERGPVQVSLYRLFKQIVQDLGLERVQLNLHVRDSPPAQVFLAVILDEPLVARILILAPGNRRLVLRPDVLVDLAGGKRDPDEAGLLPSR